MKRLLFWVLRMAILLFMVLDLNAKTQGALTQSVECTSLDGWEMKFNSDGSAVISYGSLPTDQARVVPGIFELQSVEKLINSHVKDSSTSSKRVAVNVFKGEQISSIATYADDVVPFQMLCRKVIMNASFVDIKRFRELVAQYPPFGLEDVVINNNQASTPQPIIPQLTNANSELQQKNNVAGEPKPTPKPPTVWQPPTSQTAPEAMPAPSTSEGPASSIPWRLILLLVVASTGLLWFLLKRR